MEFSPGPRSLCAVFTCEITHSPAQPGREENVTVASFQDWPHISMGQFFPQVQSPPILQRTSSLSSVKLACFHVSSLTESRMQAQLSPPFRKLHLNGLAGGCEPLLSDTLMMLDPLRRS